jgi:hypothetical protein
MKQQMVSDFRNNSIHTPANRNEYEDASSVGLHHSSLSWQESNVADDKDQLWSKALDLLDQMKKEGAKADAITYSSEIIPNLVFSDFFLE